MAQNSEEIPLSALFDAQNYDISSLDSEIRADRYSAQLLKHFHRWLLKEQYEALEAGRLAAGADYFLREFLIGARRQNIFTATAQQLRQFGGNWYIISNLEPNFAELGSMLRGAALFYTYAATQKLVTDDSATAFCAAAEQNDFYCQRIEAFNQLVDDGYSAWDQACPLR